VLVASAFGQLPVGRVHILPAVLYAASEQRALLRGTALQEPGEENFGSCGIANNAAGLPNYAV